MSASENENDQTIVINDLLSFIWCKRKLCSKEQLLKCIEEFYSAEAASEALKTLLTALPSKVSSLQQNWQETNTFVAIMNALEIPNEEELPIFVCKNLNNIPKLEIVKQEPMDSAIESKREFYREHQRIKSQLNEVFSSLFELKKQFLTITESRANDAQFGKKSPVNDSPKDFMYLQNILDEEKDGEIEEMFCENSQSDSEDDVILEQRINLIANRRQRASLRSSKEERKLVKKCSSSSSSTPKVIHIANDGKTSVADASDASCVASNNGQGWSNPLAPQGPLKKDGCRFLIVEHTFHEILGNLTLYKCSACSFCSNDERTAMKHVCIKVSFEKKPSARMKLQSTPNEQQKEKMKLKRQKVYECHSCGSSFKMRKELQKHIESHLEGGHRCPLCTNRFPLEEWKDHVTGCPGNGSTSRDDHYCDICDVFYADKRTLSFHKAFHDPSRPFECLECKFRFYTQKTVEDHFRAHKVHRHSKKCPFCEFRAAKQIKIIDHIRCHTGDRPYKCSQCERFCPTYNALKVHLTSHAPTRDFGCDICGKKFKSQGKVASHRKIHTHERPHKCPICGKGFKFGLQMALHHRMHLDIRKHACPQCPYRARTAAILRGHMNTHTNIKPFKCPKCKFGANHKSYLNWHLKFYHPYSDNVKMEEEV